MKSHITLELEAGATLLFSDSFDDYLPFVEVRHEGVMMKSFQPLIYAVDAENITIKGEGTLDGQGKKWWMEFFRVMIDLRDNGMRNVNKYQTMWDQAMIQRLSMLKQTRTTSVHCNVAFSVLRLSSRFVVRT